MGAEHVVGEFRSGGRGRPAPRQTGTEAAPGGLSVPGPGHCCLSVWGSQTSLSQAPQSLRRSRFCSTWKVRLSSWSARQSCDSGRTRSAAAAMDFLCSCSLCGSPGSPTFLVACGMFSCGTWGQFPDQGSNPGPLRWQCGILPLDTRDVPAVSMLF